MNAPLLSNWWYRVAARKPRLRSHARLYRHRYRGEVWYLLQDPASTRVHRFSPSARLIIALMDGKRSIAELWEIANKHLGEDAPTQDEVILPGEYSSITLAPPDKRVCCTRPELSLTSRKRTRWREGGTSSWPQQQNSHRTGIAGCASWASPS